MSRARVALVWPTTTASETLNFTTRKKLRWYGRMSPKSADNPSSGAHAAMGERYFHLDLWREPFTIAIVWIRR